MLLKRTAIGIGNWVWNNIDEKDNEKKSTDLIELQNKFKIIVLNIALITTFILFGLLTGLWEELGLSLLSFVFIRWWNGGHHFSVDACYFLTMSVIVGVIPLSYISSNFSLFLLIIAISLNIIYAPFGISSNHKQYYLKKIISIILIIISFYINEIFLLMWFILGFDLIKVLRR